MLSETDRAALTMLFPELPHGGINQHRLDRCIETWFMRDHFAGNPAYEGFEDEEMER